MDETEIKHVVEAALLAAGRPLTLEQLADLFKAKGSMPDRATLKSVLEALGADYQGRGIELREVGSGYRVQIKRTMTDWLAPLWEERAPRYTRALLETLALIAYRQPITRAEIEEVRGVVVSTNIIRTLLERNWIRVVGHRDVPGKPAMFGTTRDFLDYFGLAKLEDLPPLAELKDGMPELSPQADLVESLEAAARLAEGGLPAAAVGEDVEAQDAAVGDAHGETAVVDDAAAARGFIEAAGDYDQDDEDDDDDLDSPDLELPPDEEPGDDATRQAIEQSEDVSPQEASEVVIEARVIETVEFDIADGEEAGVDGDSGDEDATADVIPLRARKRGEGFE